MSPPRPPRPATSLALRALLLLLALLPGCSDGEPVTGARAEIRVAETPESHEAAQAARLEPGARGGTVVMARPTGPRTMNWVAGSRDGTTDLLAHLISDSLVYNDARLELVPKLARSWEWSEDRLTLTFHLREAARWEDGTPVSADDVLYTFEAIRDPDSGADNLRAQFNMVESVSAPDARTVVVRYREPFAPAVASWNVALLPAHRYRDQPDFHDNPLARTPLSCGPWKLVSWDPDREVVLEPNPDYYLGSPGPERLVVRFIREMSTRFQALENGELSIDSLSPIFRQRALGDEDFLSRFRLEPYYVLYLWYVAWNGDGTNPYFTDPRVRRAMTLALDREGYAAGPFFGQAKVATSSFHPVQWAYDRELEPWPYDPGAARALLREAGFADTDGDGVLEREGRPFHFTFTYAAVGEDNRRLAAWLRDSLAEVGVEVELEPLPWPALQERLAERRFESLMLGLWMDVDPDPFELWHSSQAEAGINRVAYRNEEVDRLLEEGRRQVDREKRRAAYRRVQALLHRDQPFTFLFYPASSAAISRRLRGVGISPRGAYLFWPGPSAWWLSPEEDEEPTTGE